MRRLIIQDGKTKQEIEYTTLSDSDIDKRIRQYEKKYGRTYQEFYGEFECDRASMDELGDLLDWESLVEEGKTRLEKAVK